MPGGDWALLPLSLGLAVLLTGHKDVCGVPGSLSLIYSQVSRTFVWGEAEYIYLLLFHPQSLPGSWAAWQLWKIPFLGDVQTEDTETDMCCTC